MAEVLAYFSRRGTYLRQAAVLLAERVLADPNIEVVEQTRPLVLRGL
jgi:hypothetical protein